MSKKQIGIIAGAVVLAIAIIITTIVVTRKPAKDEVAEEPVAAPVEEVPDDLVTDQANGGRSYLTGEVIGEEQAAKRPVAVMVENTKECTPHYGLNTASIIMEAPVEGSITRMMAIFEDYSSLNRIGNVRSSRPYYIYVAKEFEAIYVHFGGSAVALEMLDNGIINNLNGLVDDAVFFRSTDKKAPHNAYTSAEGIDKGVEKHNYSTEYSDNHRRKFNFAEDGETVDLANGSDCEVISLYYFYNHPWFEYDKETGLYNRFQFGGKHIDALDNEQVAVKNIIFQDVPWSIYEGTQYLNIPMTGSGTGKFFTNGKMEDITWTKNSDDEVTHYFDANGEEIVLNQGRTWICLIQDTYKDKNTFYATKEEFKNN